MSDTLILLDSVTNHAKTAKPTELTSGIKASLSRYFTEL